MLKLAPYIFTATIALLSPPLVLAQSSATEHTAKTKVVLQVSDDDPKKWNLVLSNAKNIQKDLGEKNVDIAIVAFGPGIGIFKGDSGIAARVREAKADGMVLSACENTMAAQNLKKEDMNPAVGYVPSGVVEIIRKEKAGYAYLRP
jgi:intracellular sulfur oxidation DsrE/DsrF family protein